MTADTRQDERTERPKVGDQCTAYRGRITQCTGPSIRTGYRVCVHEHIKDIALCAYHVGLPMICRTCGVAGHQVEARMVYDPLGAPS